MSMDTTFPGNHLMYRSITSPLLHNIAYCAIIAGEALTGIVLAIAAWRLWSARGDAERFAVAKGMVALGAALAFLIWFVGFLVIAGEWFVGSELHRAKPGFGEVFMPRGAAPVAGEMFCNPALARTLLEERLQGAPAAPLRRRASRPPVFLVPRAGGQRP